MERNGGQDENNAIINHSPLTFYKLYTDKKQVLQVVSLLKAHEVKQIVLCPGSRNIPLLQAFSTDAFFECHQVTDERSAGFFALGLALHGGKPAAVCCTSGSALLNIHPAVAEAFYQQVPLVVLSADRPAAWIGQMDGQTLPQEGVYKGLCKYAVSLPEVHTAEDEWYANRLVNEALLATNHRGKGPVHINIPIAEPFFAFPTETLPEVRVITRYQGLNVYDREYETLVERLNGYSRRLMLAGQMNMIYLFERKVSKLLYKHFAWFTEHIGNRTVPGMPIKNFDTLLYSFSEEQKEKMRPDLVITYGGHFVSGRLKQYLRAFPPKEHWHVSRDGEVVDVFGQVSTIIEMDPFEFLEKIAYLLENKATPYPIQWENLSKQVAVPQLPFSEMAAIGALMQALPSEAVLHLGNSSTIRYAQLFPLNPNTEVCGNRGVSGIEGSLSTALGYASLSKKPNFIVMGDLSFFYDMNVLGNKDVRNNVRVLLLNNGGGEIFDALPGLKLPHETAPFVTATHALTAEAWAKDCGFRYFSASNEEELTAGIAHLTNTDAPNSEPLFLEVFTDRKEDVRLLKEYYKSIVTH